MIDEDNIKYAIVIITLATILIITLFTMSDNIDVDDVLAPMLCEQRGMDVESVEYEMHKNNMHIGEITIQCKERVEDYDSNTIVIGGLE